MKLHAIQRSYREEGPEGGRSRAWKLFYLTSRMLLHRAPGEDKIPKETLLARVDRFQRGDWAGLLAEAHASVRAPGGERRQAQQHRSYAEMLQEWVGSR